MTDISLTDEWRSRLDDQARSGLSMKKWCAAHDIPVHRFFYWRQKFSQSGASAPGDRVDWLPVSLSSSPPSQTSLTVRVGIASIDIAPGFDAALLRAVVLALEPSKC